MKLVNFHDRQDLVQCLSRLAWERTNITYYGIICIAIHELIQFIRDISRCTDTAKEQHDLLLVILQQNFL